MGDYVRQLQLPGESSDFSRRQPLALRLHLDLPLLLLLPLLLPQQLVHHLIARIFAKQQD